MITNPLVLLVIAFAILLALMLTGFKLGICLAMAGVFGFIIFKGDAGLAAFVPYRTLDSFVLTAVPLFIFMGEVLMRSGASDIIYRGASKLISWAPGGLLHSNILACALFAAVSGSSPATAATIGTVAIPELKKRGYDTRLIVGSLAAGGTLGILIPPSINMIVYALLTATSVGALFAGGVIPGIILSIIFMLYIGVKATLHPTVAPREKNLITIKSIILSLFDLWPLLVIWVVVLGGIFAGYVTPTEAAAVGTAVSLLIAIVLRKLNWRLLRESLKQSIETTCMALFIVVGASIMASFMARAGIPRAISDYVVTVGLSKWFFLIFVYFVYLFLGCFMDPLSMMILTISTVLPILVNLGFDPIWFGVILIILSEIAMVTPPVAVNIFVIQGISRESMDTVVAGTLPFVVLMLLSIVLFTIYPSLILWLPSLMFSG